MICNIQSIKLESFFQIVCVQLCTLTVNDETLPIPKFKNVLTDNLSG